MTSGRWLSLGRACAGLLLAGLALLSQDAFRSTGLLYLAAVGAGLLALAGWLGRDRQAVIVPSFLGDIAWISAAVAGAGRMEAGLTLLFPLVAFSAGLCVGGGVALGISLTAGLALVGSVMAASDLHGGPGWLFLQGVLVVVLGAVSDRTRAHLASREHALELALEKMRLDTDTIVQNLASGVLSVDRSGRVIHVNQAAEETLGIEARAIRGSSIATALPDGAEPLVKVIQDGLRTGVPTTRCEVEILRENGSIPLGLGTTVLSGPEREPTGVVALFQDLTEVRRQEQLARRRDRLAAVGELAAGIAHEIRNSILPISGSVQILAQELHLDPEQDKLFEVVAREAENVERFVGALLRYTRSDSLHLQRVDLSVLARTTAEESGLGRANAPRVEIEVEGESAWAWADEDQVRQALRNLVMNAADAAGSHGRIVLRAGTMADGKPWIEVSDDGPGIPPDQRNLVVQPFYTTKAGGTGLGLAIVSRIVEDHEGELRVQDTEGGGARFRILLPQADAEPAVAAAT